MTGEDAVRLSGLLAALSRAGLPTGRAWSVLADGTGAEAEVATTVAGMLAIGGSVADGVRLAAGHSTGPGAPALGWLAVSADVIDRTGCPAAGVLDGVAEGMLAELTRAGEREVALAGPRATAAVLTGMPLAGMALGAVMGANPVAALLGTGAGRVSLVAGLMLWLAGRAWSARLVAAVEREAL